MLYHHIRQHGPGKAADEAQTALTEAQDALTNAAEDADKDALQAAVDAAQAAYDEAKAAGMANAKAKGLFRLEGKEYVLTKCTPRPPRKARTSTR